MTKYIWTGVFRGEKLVDVSEGAFHAAERAADLTQQTKQKHHTAPVIVEPAMTEEKEDGEIHVLPEGP